MNTVLQAFINSLPLFTTLAIVIFLKSKGIFKESSANAISILIFKLVLPFFVFATLFRLDFDISDSKVLLVIIFIHLVLLGAMLLLGKLFRTKEQILGTVLMLSIAYSAGPVAYPFVQLNFSEDVFFKVVVVDITLFIMIMILSPLISAVFDVSQKMNYKSVIKSIITDPILISVFLAFVVNLLNLELPEAVIATVESIGAPFTFLVTVFIGLTLKLPDLTRLKLLSFLTFFRLVSAIVISILIVLVVSPTEIMGMAIILTLFTSFSSFPIVYTDKHNLDSELVAQVAIFSRIIILILYPILIAFLLS